MESKVEAPLVKSNIANTLLKFAKTKKQMKTALIAIALLGLGVAGIAIKIWAKKDGEFEGTCASNNPLITKEGEPCGFCGAEPEEQCKSEEIAS